jgi:hypothetical protein
MKHLCDVDLAVEYGFDHSIFLTNSYKDFKKKIVIKDDELISIFPYFSKRKLKKILNDLISSNIISFGSDHGKNFYYLTKKGNLLTKGI